MSSGTKSGNSYRRGRGLLCIVGLFGTLGISISPLVAENVTVDASEDITLSRKAEKAIGRGVDWILKQQDARDGGWHSQTYGAMRGGASATALALYVGSHLPEQYRRRSEWKFGLEFLLRGMSKRDCIACPDGTLDYPTYSTALTLIATRQLGLKVPADTRKKLVAYLISAQLTEKNNFALDHVDYGGWDLLGASGAIGITSGTNTSVSFYAVQALSGEEHNERDAAIKRALKWVQRCQNFSDSGVDLDGGFYFHPERDSLGNKAQWEDERFMRPRSYGTATCDGISLMTLAGWDAKNERVSSAIRWLDVHSSVAKVPGFEDAPEELGWDVGLKFYYLMGLSRVMAQLPKKTQVQRRRLVVEELLSLQREDGTWQNDSGRMREDDPHIATSFALIALTNLAGVDGI